MEEVSDFIAECAHVGAGVLAGDGDDGGAGGEDGGGVGRCCCGEGEGEGEEGEGGGELHGGWNEGGERGVRGRGSRYCCL